MTSQSPAVPGPRVVMLMWEIPPLVAGGTWTACYHMIRTLRRRGADVTVVVPWAASVVIPTAFGTDVTVVALGIAPPDAAHSAYSGGTLASSTYGQGSQPLWSSYGTGWSSYGHIPGIYSASAASAYGTALSSYDAAAARATLRRLSRAYRQRVEHYLADHPADLIHAQDWVTFEAARAASDRFGIPWIAHVHSTEHDRRPNDADKVIERMERTGILHAARVVTPSEITGRNVTELYRADPARIDVVPNPLADVDPANASRGSLDQRRVIFLGRLTRQKGVDRFGAVADAVRAVRPDVRFEAYGDGEERTQLTRHGVRAWGAIGWDERGKAFADASILLVPSRAEPFGMVVLEAMEHGVPVIYPDDAGAAEVLASGVKVRSGDIGAMASAVTGLLDHPDAWHSVATAQAREIRSYPDRGHDVAIMDVWRKAACRAA